jgi:hypothetical protein
VLREIEAFGTRARAWYKSHSEFVSDGNDVSVDVDFTSSQTVAEIEDYVKEICEDILMKANSAVCDREGCSDGEDPISIFACEWMARAAKKRQVSPASAITVHTVLVTSSATTLSAFVGVLACIVLALLQ